MESITGKVKLSSSDENVARIIGFNSFRAVNEGEATITVEYGGIKKTAKVTVKKSNRKLKEIHVSPSMVVIEGESYPFSVIASYDDGYHEDVTKSSEISVANKDIVELINGSMYGSMYLKGKKEGETKVKATYEGLTIEGQ